MSTTHYLSRHAEPEAAQVATLKGNYEHVVCIPAFDEAPDFLESVTCRLKARSVLAIVVANASRTASALAAERTRAIVDHLLDSGQCRARPGNNLWLLERPTGPDVLLVDRCSPPYCPDGKGGVGLARKIACDLALALHAREVIHSPWIHTTDADARLPADYFSATSVLDSRQVSAAVYPFRHTRHGDRKVDLAQRLYDDSLDYYVAGLRWAGSPWAFHTIGSTLVINSHHYAQARGFPKRRAAEDFYLLNKLAKSGPVISLQTSPVTLTSRLSDRVPFGTGPALRKISAMADPLEDFLFYHPLCFTYLKAWHALAENLWDAGERPLDPATIDDFIAARREFAEIDGGILASALAYLGTGKAVRHAFTNSKSRGVFNRHLCNWFDAFRTLKFIHWLRDHHLPSVCIPAVKAQSGLTRFSG